MATPVFLCGFECQSNATAVQGHWANITAGASMAVQQTTARNSGSALRILAAGGGTRRLASPALSGTACVVRLYMNLVTLPSVTEAELGFVYTAGTTRYCIGFNQATGKWSYGPTGAQLDGPSAVANTWVAIDILVNVAANPHTMDIKFDGVAQAQKTNAIAASTISAVYIGGAIAGDSGICYDDVAISLTSGDYPLTHTMIVGYKVGNTSGTHNDEGDNDFQDEGGNNVTDGDATGAKINESVAVASDYIKQVTSNAAYYAEYIYATSGATMNPLWVQQVVGVSASGTGTCKEKSQLYDGTTAGDAYAAVTVGSVSLVYRNKCWAVSPTGGAWTLAQLKACRLRWGFSNDVNPVPYLCWTILEAAGTPPAGRSFVVFVQ